MAKPRHDPTRSLLEPRKNYPYIGVIGQELRWVEGWDNSSARFDRAKMFYAEYKDQLPEDVTYNEICFCTQVFKANEKVYAPMDFVLRSLNGHYQIKDEVEEGKDGTTKEE